MKRHSSFRLRWSRYYQYIVEGQVFYLKLKAYTNRNEGMKEWELIIEQTYKNAVNKGYQDNLVIVEEEVAFIPVQALTLIFNKIYQLSEKDMRKAVYEAQESIRELRKHTRVKPGLEYRIFKRVMELQIDDIREDYKEAM